MKKIGYFSILMLVLFLSSCSMKFKYSSCDKLRKDLIDFINKENEKGHLFSTGFTILGRYGDGYLCVVNSINIHFMETYSSTVINDIEIYHTDKAEFYYFINNLFGEDYLYIGLENIYNHGFLVDDDLLDIQSKFNEWKEQEYPYAVLEDYPL